MALRRSRARAGEVGCRRFIEARRDGSRRHGTHPAGRCRDATGVRDILAEGLRGRSHAVAELGVRQALPTCYILC